MMIQFRRIFRYKWSTEIWTTEKQKFWVKKKRIGTKRSSSHSISGNSGYGRSWRDPVRAPRYQMASSGSMVSPKKLVVDQDQGQQKLTCHLIRQVLHAPQKHELFIYDITVTNPRKSSKCKATSKLWSSWNSRTKFTVFIATDTSTSGLVSCHRGCSLVDAHPDPVFEDQILRDVEQQFDLFTTLAFSSCART